MEEVGAFDGGFDCGGVGFEAAGGDVFEDCVDGGFVAGEEPVAPVLVARRIDEVAAPERGEGVVGPRGHGDNLRGVSHDSPGGGGGGRGGTR